MTEKILLELTREEYDAICSAIMYKRAMIEHLGVSDTTRAIHHKLVALEKKLEIKAT